MLSEFWLKNKDKRQGSNYQIDKELLLEIPIVKSYDKPVVSKLSNLVETKEQA